MQRSGEEEEGSAHCSSIGSGAGGDEIINFFRDDILDVQEWHFDKDESQENTTLPRKFIDYADAAADELNVTMFRIENSQLATERIAIVDESDKRIRL